MEKKNIRYIILIVTAGIALILFLFNIRRTAPENLPPTPTFDYLSTQIALTQTISYEQPFPSSTPSLSPSPEVRETAEVELPTEGIQPSEMPTLSAVEMTATQESYQVQVTQQAENMASFIDQLYASGVIDTKEGEFHSISDFDQTWDKPGYFQWWRTPYRLKEFVLRMNMSWKSEDPYPDIATTGCGLIFAENGPENMVRTFLFLDGHIRLYRMLVNKFEDLAYGYSSQIYSPSGNAQIVYILKGKTFRMYVNEDLVIEKDIDYLSEGYLGFAITSGTAEGFLMRCEMFNIELWTFPNN